MPRIPENFSQYVFYLFKTVTDAECGSRSGGTGALIAVPLNTPRLNEISITIYKLYAVTNKHLIDNGCKILRLNRRDGGTEILDLSSSEWLTDDNNDLAACYIESELDEPELMFRWIDADNDFVTEQDVVSIVGDILVGDTLEDSNDPDFKQVGIGDDVFMIGRFIGHDQSKWNIPLVRFGNIAAPPNEKIIIPHPAYPDLQQETIYVEMRSLNGFSGSPVFWYSPIVPLVTLDYRREYYDIRLGKSKLLGIDWGHMHWWDNTYKRDPQSQKLTPIDDERVRNNPGVAMVVPAWRLREFLNRKEFKDLRDNVERETNIANSVIDSDTFT